MFSFCLAGESGSYFSRRNLIPVDLPTSASGAQKGAATFLFRIRKTRRIAAQILAKPFYLAPGRESAKKSGGAASAPSGHRLVTSLPSMLSRKLFSAVLRVVVERVNPLI
jgi:hypothetical protein